MRHEPEVHDAAQEVNEDAAELQELIAKQQVDDKYYVSPPSGSVSLDADWIGDGESRGHDFVGIEYDFEHESAALRPTHGSTRGAAGRKPLTGAERVALRHLVDQAVRARVVMPNTPSAEAGGPQVRSYAPRFGPVWDEATIVSRTHPFRDTRQFSEAYGGKWRTTTRAVRILVKLFDAITVAVGGASDARAAARKRGKPTILDARARMLMALAVQAFREMGHAPSAIGRSLSLEPSTITRYSNLALPVLSPEAFARVFPDSGGTAATSSDEIQPSSDTDATRGRSDDRPPRPLRRRKVLMYEETIAR